MIRHRHVFIVRQQWVFRPVDAPSGGCMVDAGEEVGVVADGRGQVHRAVRRAMQQARRQRCNAGMVRTVGVEQVRYALPQRKARAGAQCKQWVQCRPRSGFRGIARGAGEQSGLQRRRDVEDGVADRHAAARLAARRAEDAERQVLDGELAVAVGGFHPTLACRVVRGVDHRFLRNVRRYGCLGWQGKPLARRSPRATAGLGAIG